MTETIRALDDDTFLRQFEDQTLPPEHFNHQGHVRLAWLYLSRQDQAEAANKISQGIMAYATSLGATAKFHATITDALINIIALRRARTAAPDWLQFLSQNSDLLSDAQSLIGQYYSPERLQSPEARTQVLPPDLRPFEQPDVACTP